MDFNSLRKCVEKDAQFKSSNTAPPEKYTKNYSKANLVIWGGIALVVFILIITH